MILYDLTHTAHSSARTGIQRQARSILAALGPIEETVPICFDPYAAAWRPLDTEELPRALGGGPLAAGRRARWGLGRRLRSWYERFTHRVPPLPAADGFVCPEIFAPSLATRLPDLFAQIRGPRVAFFFDTIPLTHPELTPAKTVARFPAYMQELLHFDGIAANSRTTADSLAGYWRWLGITVTPAVTVLPLGVELPAAAAVASPVGPVPEVLCVGSLEGRKNHLALLGAAETLWAEGVRFELRLVGLPRPETAAAALREIQRLQLAGRPLHFEGALDDVALEAAWQRCAFSVYPSLIEGFGLPVLESLARGKPCVCAAAGATGELIADGGCVGVESPNAPSLAAALRELLTQPARLAQLSAEARQRPIPTWQGCAQHLAAWMKELAARAPCRVA